MQKRRGTVLALKSESFPIFARKSREKGNADKTPLSTIPRHAMHLRFSITSRHDVVETFLANCVRPRNRACSMRTCENRFNAIHIFVE